MRHLAIGDIHGYSQVLRDLLDFVDLAADDVLVTLGDYVDRGPGSNEVLDLLIQLNQTGQLVPIRGNHDQMMLSAREGRDFLEEWRMCGGQSTLESYGKPGQVLSLDAVPQEHWNFLENVCVDWYEIDTHFFVHANVYPEVELEEQPLFMLHWEPLYSRASMPHCSGKIMVCGHTNQRDGVPLNLGHVVCIDTWVYGDGWLTCLDVDTGKYWQANQDGQRRQDYLPDPDE